MALRERLLPWDSQPQEAAKAREDWARVYNFSQRGNDAANGRVTSWGSGALPYEAGTSGVGLRVTSPNVATSGEYLAGEIGGAITVVFVAEKFGQLSGGSDFIFGEHAITAGAYNFGFYESASSGDLFFFIHNGTTGVNTGGNTSWRANQGPQVWVATYGGGDNNVRLYLNGNQVASAAQTGNIQRNSGALLRSCFWNSGTPNFRIYAGAVSPKRLSASEIKEKFGSLSSAWGELFEPRRVYIPTAAGGAGAQTLTPSLYSDAQSFFAPTVSVGAVSLAPSLLTNAQTFYAPTVSQGAQVLTPALLTNTSSFYAPSVAVGVVALSPSLLTNAQSFYAPVVSQGGQVLAPDLYTNSQSFYAPTVTVGAVALSPGLFTNGQTFFVPYVSDGSAAPFVKYFDVLSGRLLILRAL